MLQAGIRNYSLGKVEGLTVRLYIYIYIHTHRVSQEECTKLRQSVPYVKLYRYNPKHPYPKLNVYGDNVHRKVWSSCVFHALYLVRDTHTHTHIYIYIYNLCLILKLAKTGHGPHSSKIVVLFYVLFVLYRSMCCLCVNVYCTSATG